jgi:hypothetical protein
VKQELKPDAYTYQKPQVDYQHPGQAPTNFSTIPNAPQQPNFNQIPQQNT